MRLHQLLLEAVSHFGFTDCLGYIAAGLVLAAFSVKSIRMPRCIAILNNLAFISTVGFCNDPDAVFGKAESKRASRADP